MVLQPPLSSSVQDDFEPVAGVCDAQKLLGSQCRLGAHQHPNAEAYDLTLEPDTFADLHPSHTVNLSRRLVSGSVSIGDGCRSVDEA
ncbi:hypothetical protein D9758_018729 [Tetrapyrgos nigripes]|uniref:Uncharacterized protein n=1 Tax=Tetrapyrgos nigripes TaxID=182062 RepID=A0A8H5BVE5_9AGAR|nr:hypothetical protein D9758_018729 [Tetrapyrgos nigripes]